MNRIWKKEEYFQWFLQQQKLYSMYEKIVDIYDTCDLINEHDFVLFTNLWLQSIIFERKYINILRNEIFFLPQKKIKTHLSKCTYENCTLDEKYNLCQAIYKHIKEKDRYVMHYIVNHI
jgi:hypothetical protein